MMEFISSLGLFGMAVLIYFLRIVDVSLGTIRTLSIVSGRGFTAFMLGFFEVLIWIIAISQVFSKINESFFLAVVYALGFASGNACGIWLEKKIGIGISVIRIISQKHGEEIAKFLREKGQPVTTFIGEGKDGNVTLIYATTKGHNVEEIIKLGLEIDPNMFYVIEPAKTWNRKYVDIGYHNGGWRQILKKK